MFAQCTSSPEFSVVESTTPFSSSHDFLWGLNACLWKRRCESRVACLLKQVSIHRQDHSLPLCIEKTWPQERHIYTNLLTQLIGLSIVFLLLFCYFVCCKAAVVQVLDRIFSHAIPSSIKTYSEIWFQSNDGNSIRTNILIRF